jgi:endonuclease-8
MVSHQVLHTMPEGPSLIIVRNEAAKFVGRTVREVSGNSRIEIQRMRRRRVVAIRTWGKHLLIEFSNFSLRVHFMLYGSYRIDEQRPPPAALRLGLVFDNGEFNFYACSLRFIEEPLDDVYDWRVDVMAEAWDPALAHRKLKKLPDTWVCDALLDQQIFSGVGNYIKNEVLYRISVHPCSRLGALPPRKLSELITQARQYAFDSLAWKQAHVLRKHWLVHNKGQCAKGHGKLVRAHLGKTHRRSFYCPVCQPKFE